MISSALTHGEIQKSFQQKKVTDVVDMMYKGALIKEMGSRSEIGKINAERQLTESMRQAPLETPGLGKLSFDQWKSLDTKTKAYSYYAYDAKQNSEEVMPYNEWEKQTDTPTAYDIYKLGEKDEGFKKFYEEDYKSGTTINIGDKVEQAGALADVKTEKYYSDPKGGLSVATDKHLGSEDIQMELDRYRFKDDKTEYKAKKEQVVIDFTKKQILAGGNEIVKEGYDGNDMVWIFKTKAGKTVEYRRPR